MGRATLVAMYSMNECEECEVDPRPNLFDNPLTNWAHQTLDGWNIHHTTQVNWARNLQVDLVNWQFSAWFKNIFKHLTLGIRSKIKLI